MNSNNFPSPDTESDKEEINPKINPDPDPVYFHCTIGNCRKKYKNKSRYETHITSHQHEKRYKCEYESCSKVYKSKENLTLHIKNKHLRQKPYKCNHCNQSFSHRNGRLYHERRNHKKHICESNIINTDCKATFDDMSSLEYHKSNGCPI